MTTDNFEEHSKKGKGRSRSREDKAKEFDRIIENGRQMFIERGPNGFKLSQLASSLKMSPTNIYNYVDNKRELYFAITFQDRYRLAQGLTSIKEKNSEDSYLKILLEQLTFYFDFALDKKNSVDILFYNNPPAMKLTTSKTSDPGKWEQKTYGLDLKIPVYSIIESAVNNGILTGINPYKLYFTVWSLVHGASLILKDMIYTEELDYHGLKADDMKETILNQVKLLWSVNSSNYENMKNLSAHKKWLEVKQKFKELDEFLNSL